MLAEAARAATTTVVAALQRASAATGVDFRYLLGTAIRESGLQPQAHSSHSSASGLFQFVEQTWFSVMKEFGAKHGLGSYANVIQKGDDGRYHAPDADDRRAILLLRNDPQISAIMAGEYTRKTQGIMESKLGRPVCGGELYAGHLLGPGAACRLIRTNELAPKTAAADLFPKAAEANQSVFFNADGSAKSVREVYNWTVAQPRTSAVTAVSASAPAAVPSMAILDTDNTAALFASMWGPQKHYFSSSETPATQPIALTPAILDILSTVAKDRGSS
jgi:hypothetical protein